MCQLGSKLRPVHLKFRVSNPNLSLFFPPHLNFQFFSLHCYCPAIDFTITLHFFLLNPWNRLTMVMLRKQSVCTQAYWPTQLKLITVSMWHEVAGSITLLPPPPLDRMLVPHIVISQHFLRLPRQFAGNHLHSRVERGIVRVKCQTH